MTKKTNTIQEKIMNEPPANIYFIRNKESKFYNSRDSFWYSEMINANYESKKNLPLLKQLLLTDRFSGCEIYETTSHKLWEAMATWTTDAVLTGNYFCELLHKIACKLPTITAIDKLMYQKCKLAIEVLQPLTTWNNEFLESKEDTTDEVSGIMMEYFSVTSSVPIYEMARVTKLIKNRKIKTK